MPDIDKFMSQLESGVARLQRLGLAHNNIKLENVVVFKRRRESGLGQLWKLFALGQKAVFRVRREESLSKRQRYQGIDRAEVLFRESVNPFHSKSNNFPH